MKKERNTAESTIRKALDLAHGNGLDYAYEFARRGKSLSVKTHFHAMNECGYYIGVIPVSLTFNLDNMDFSIRCKNTGVYYMLKDELYDRIFNALSAIGSVK